MVASTSSKRTKAEVTAGLTSPVVLLRIPWSSNRSATCVARVSGAQDEGTGERHSTTPTPRIECRARADVISAGVAAQASAACRNGAVGEHAGSPPAPRLPTDEARWPAGRATAWRTLCPAAQRSPIESGSAAARAVGSAAKGNGSLSAVRECDPPEAPLGSIPGCCGTGGRLAGPA